MAILNERARQAYQLWKQREGQRPVSDTATRLQLRVARLGDWATKEAQRSPQSLALVEQLGLERVIGAKDFVGIDFVERALAVARTVGFVNIGSGGSGTGFMVSPHLMLTNNHVLSDLDEASRSEIIFDYQRDRFGRPMMTHVFKLQPSRFFITNPDLDYTLVAVADRTVTSRELKDFGWNKLIAAEGKAVIGDPVNIIQHPLGDPKQIVLRSNRVVDLPDGTPFIHYETDTEPGSSGSPAYNDQWEIIALHHSGVPELNPDGTVQRWIANEGIRISRLMADLKLRQLSAAQDELRAELLDATPPDLLELAYRTIGQPTTGGSASSSASSSHVSMTIPVTLTVTLGMSVGQAVAPGVLPPPGVTSDPAVVPRPGVGASSTQPAMTDPVSGDAGVDIPGFAEALAALEASKKKQYYDRAKDEAERAAYYQGIRPETNRRQFFDTLADLVRRTHKATPKYAPARLLYPWVDLVRLIPQPVVKSVYSGKEFAAVTVIREELKLEAARERLAEVFRRERLPGGHHALAVQSAALEAQAPFNCEHVVPQSWFSKREPMRGDLHHLFTCESGCNSFRGNTPYFDFVDFEEAVRDACGKRETGSRVRIIGFEPEQGKGEVAPVLPIGPLDILF